MAEPRASDLVETVSNNIANDVSHCIRTAVLDALENDISSILNQHVRTAVANTLEKEKAKILKDEGENGKNFR
jgi:hypothetical protein